MQQCFPVPFFSIRQNQFHRFLFVCSYCSSPQWTRIVNGVETEAELKALRQSVARETPFGDADWQNVTAAQAVRK